MLDDSTVPPIAWAFDAFANIRPSCSRSASFQQKSIFLGPNGIRAGWRLAVQLIFTSVWIAVLFHFVLHIPPWKAPNFRLGELLPRELIALFATLTAAAIMARIEQGPFGSFGLPWKHTIPARSWEGAVWGFTAMTVVLLILRASRSFSFGTMELHGRQFLIYALGWEPTFLRSGFMKNLVSAAIRNSRSRPA